MAGSTVKLTFQVDDNGTVRVIDDANAKLKESTETVSRLDRAFSALKVSAGSASFGLRVTEEPLPTLREAIATAPGAMLADVDGAALATALACVRGTVGEAVRHGLNGVCRVLPVPQSLQIAARPRRIAHRVMSR